ncbi:MAG TPA: hypothetical protein V6C52_03505 [Coleofasciculaceae cyanobacterium]|jgi:hypothetical protein
MLHFGLSLAGAPSTIVTTRNQSDFPALESYARGAGSKPSFQASVSVSGPNNKKIDDLKFMISVVRSKGGDPKTLEVLTDDPELVAAIRKNQLPVTIKTDTFSLSQTSQTLPAKKNSGDQKTKTDLWAAFA